MKIRRAEAEDVEMLTGLFNDYRVFYKKESDLPAAANFLNDRIRNKESVIFVAEDSNKKMVGFVQLYPLFSSTSMKRLWLLNDLFVNPELRGQGIAVALIESCKELCRQTAACGLMLETAKDNTIGNNLYPKAGFILNSEHNYYEWDT